MADTLLRTESSVRKHLSRGIWQRIRQTWMLRGIGSAGEGLYLERNVRLLRHPQNVDLGSWVIVKEGARLCPANRQARIRIGDWTTIGYHTYVFATAGVEIGANCLIAPFCYLVDSNHGVRRDQLIREQPMSASPIVIEEDVWLGAGVTVLKGVKIGRGAVVGAGSVVSTDVPAYAIASGNPLQITGERRFKDAIIDVES